MNCGQRRGAHRTLILIVCAGAIGAGVLAALASQGDTTRLLAIRRVSQAGTAAQVPLLAEAPPVAAVPAGVTVSSAYVPHVAKSAPEEPVLPTPGPTPEPTPGEVVAQSEPVAVQTVSANAVEQLTPEGLEATLRQAGWPEYLLGEASRVVEGESHRHPGSVGDGGRSLGLFQLNAATWAPYCGVTPEHLLDPLWNAWCAYKVYLYDIGRGHEPWKQWSVKP